jgi:hypothetical protein
MRGRLSWSPTSSHLTANSDLDVDFKYEIYAVRADGTQFSSGRPGVTYNWSGLSTWEWLPNGSRLAYLTDVTSNGAPDLQSALPDGMDRVTLSDPTASPGGA